MTLHQFKFNGKAGEYFGIWIVNVLLTIVTLGIYGAWAKVRDKKYFYGQTELDEHRFDYHATGMQIFIGRLIVVGGLLVLGVLSAISPILYLIGILALLVCIPWIICRALRFNARVSSYRNVRFDFTGGAGGAFLSFFVLPIANVFTLYLCTPFVSRSVHRFVTNNSKYGDRSFEFDSDIGKYYTPFLIAIAIGIGGFIALSILFGGAMAGLSGAFAGGDVDAMAENPAFIGAILGLYLGLILVVVPATLIYQAWIRNVLFNQTVLDERHHLKSNVHPGRFIWIVVSNTLAALVSFGLLIPWGRVRLAKYMASVTALESADSLEGYTSSVVETAGVVSSEYVDMEGFDIDVGI
jgi:uncharacterized membrane protein YjgN (DUF898 family)